MGEYTSLQLDTGGNPVVSYYDETTRDLKILHCNDPNCSGGGESITSPDTGGDVGQYTSLQLDAGGNPVLSYRDQTNGDLKILHCDDPNCSGGGDSITAPDNDGDVGRYYTSLQLDAGGNPVVSYQDVTNEDLKILHCNDPNCSGGGESITAPDTAGNVGRDSSLQLDTGGNPVVSYRDLTNRDLKILHCNDPNCASGSITIGKSTNPPNDLQAFDFTGDLDDFSLKDGETITFADLPPGDYSVLETLLAGWTMVGVSCGAADTDNASGAGSDGVAIHLGDSEDVTCFFNNEENIVSTPTPTPTATSSPTTTPTPTATPPPTGEPVLAQGDDDCDGDVDPADALTALRHIAGFSTNQQPGCPTLGDALPAALPAGAAPDLFGDVDCDDDVDSVDALKILRSVAAFSVTQNEPCTNIGDPL